MKHITCDICKRDIRYNGIKMRTRNFMKYFFGRIIYKIRPLDMHSTDIYRIDICEKCWNRVKEVVLHPNVVQELRGYLQAQARNQRIPAQVHVDEVPGQLTADIPALPTLTATEIINTETGRIQGEGHSSGR
jgi:hypothetical protein